MVKTKFKVSMLLLVVGLVFIFFPIGAMAYRRPQWRLMAGAYSLPITPMTTAEGIPIHPDGSQVYLAGFGSFGSRPASSVHDDIYARCLILDYDSTTIVFVQLDLIGFMIDQVDFVREEVENLYGIEADNVIIACTHTHSGPDTLGLWNSWDPAPGVNWPYMNYIRDQIIECIGNAYINMEKASIRFASTSVPGLMKNSRDPGRVYPDLEVMKVDDTRGETIATMINYAGHPEVLWSNNLELTSDYVGYLCDKVEEELGGVAVFMNGALGGMITPDTDEHTFDKAEEIGHTLADATVRALGSRRSYAWGIFIPSWKKTFNVEKQTFEVPLENIDFFYAMMGGILYRSYPWYKFPYGEFPFGTITTEVNVITIGKAQMITMPGEVLPSIGYRLKEAMTGKYNWQIGLGNDELGYIIPADEWDPDEYEESMSVGVQTGIAMEAILMNMLEGT
ncbi:MAG: neutral/alkaline non-lysosomal ceramidase N-terminal domain-containing protein [Promethearchaeota archaeon]|nr:MAG: neutral/alkaline non-lysosomal ceramidase N-terminal domain-containing protein [Candidatus Lokiarchaeota archaeon]